MFDFSMNSLQLKRSRSMHLIYMLLSTCCKFNKFKRITKNAVYFSLHNNIFCFPSSILFSHAISLEKFFLFIEKGILLMEY